MHSLNIGSQAGSLQPVPARSRDFLIETNCIEITLCPKEVSNARSPGYNRGSRSISEIRADSYRHRRCIRVCD